MTGRIGTLSLNLVIATEIGGFDGEEYKVVTDKVNDFKELYKTVASKRKYGTPQFIADLLVRYELPGPVANYAVRFVDFDNGSSGYYLASKDLSVIRYLGGHSSGEGSSDTPLNTYYTRDLYHQSRIANESATYSERIENGLRTVKQTGSYKFEAPGTFVYFNFTSEEGPYFECFCLAKGGGTYKRTEVFDAVVPSDEPLSLSDVRTFSALTYTGLIGTDYQGGMITGSMTVTPLKASPEAAVFFEVQAPPIHE